MRPTLTNAGIDHIDSFFRNVDALTYPRSHLELGVLVSDSTDRTWNRLHELVSARQASPSRFARASLFKKDFDASELENKGKARHGFEVQVQRRALLARSRSWLLSAAMTPDIDWVLWIDIDVDEVRPVSTFSCGP